MRFRIIFVLLLILSISIFVFSAGITNADEQENSKIYDNDTKTAIIEDKSGETIAKVQLVTPNVVWVSPGEDRLVAEIKIKSYEDYDEALKQIEFYNLNQYSKKENRNFVYKKKVKTGAEEIDEYGLVCNGVSENGSQICSNEITGIKIIDVYEWQEYETLDIDSGETIIGIFTDVEDGEHVEWVPTFFDVKIDEWASFIGASKQEFFNGENGGFPSTCGVYNPNWIRQTFQVGGNGTGQNFTLRGIQIKVTTATAVGGRVTFAIYDAGGDTALVYNDSMITNDFIGLGFFNISLPPINLANHTNYSLVVNQTTSGADDFRVSCIGNNGYLFGNKSYGKPGAWKEDLDQQAQPTNYFAEWFEIWGDTILPPPFPPSITTCAQLQNISNNLTEDYILSNDIDCYGIDFNPIGNSINKFSGSLDGKGFIIKNLSINKTTPYNGLFGYIGRNGYIKGVRIENLNIGGSDYTGGIAGYNEGIINNSSASGAVGTGFASSLGGIAGYNEGTIINSNASVNILGHGNRGGLVGYNKGKILNSSATGNILYSSGGNLGGLVGYNTGQINDSYSTGNVYGSGDFYVGGLVGRNLGAIGNSYANGNVANLASYTGGLVGASSGTIINSYATGSVNSSMSNLGGIAGISSGAIINSYSIGNVLGTNSKVNNVGGIAGYNTGRITNSNSSGAINGSLYVGGIAGYNNYGAISNSSSTGIINGSLYVGGIAGSNYYGNISNSFSTGNIIGKSIVGGIAGYSLRNTINNSYSTGNIIGKGDYIGGITGSSVEGAIINSYSTGIINATGSSVGGIIGYNDKTPISNSYSRGNIYGFSNLGGIVGFNTANIINVSATGNIIGRGGNLGGIAGYNTKTINNSYSTGNIQGSGDFYVGGLVGRNYYGTIGNSYSIGNAASSSSYTGGLVGASSGIIINSYSKGSVAGTTSKGGLVGYSSGICVSSYWDTTTSGLFISSCGAGKTTAEMQAKATFVAWDFVNIWDINEGINSPFLI